MTFTDEKIMLHGADLLTYKRGDKELIDFSSNINPLGYPKGLREYILDNFDRVKAYPDINYRSLKKNLEAFLGADRENLLVANGSVELIDLIISFFESIIIPYPAFMEYQYRAEKRGKRIVHIGPLEDMQTDLPSIQQALAQAPNSLLIIGNPSNPLGYSLSKKDLTALYKRAKETGSFILLDEAFSDYLDKDYDSVNLFKDDDFSNVFIIRAATKFFALPGIRLGYGVTSKIFAKKIWDMTCPWSVNTFADLASDYIFNDVAFAKNSRAYCLEQAEFMTNRLSLIKEIKIYKSQAPYILIKLLNEDSSGLFNFLLDKNILIRKCDNIRGLSNKFVRVAVKDYNLNEMLINYIKEYFYGK